jgi:hypothetical protein
MAILRLGVVENLYALQISIWGSSNTDSHMLLASEVYEQQSLHPG